MGVVAGIIIPTTGTRGINIIASSQREQGYTRPQQYRPAEWNGERVLVPAYLIVREQARPVLGAQTPPPRTAPLRYANVEPQ